jgi:hypothetical protein
MPVFTRSIKDRLFAVFLSLAFGIPAGLVVYWYYFLYPAIRHEEEGDWVLSQMINAFADIIDAATLICLLGLVWAICTPVWVEHAFGYGIKKLKKAAIFLLATVILLVAVGLVWEWRAALGK